ncbi:MAG: NusG domain II-containing protein [Ruminococcus sp.]|nr:NusG domain II-containing protein [Ruminococcus sp.]
MNKGYHFVSLKELLIISGVLIVSAAAIVIPELVSGDAEIAVIQCGDSVITADLSQSGEFTLEECGSTVFEISDGKIRIKESVCPDKICERTGFIGSAGQSIICVPERISVTVTSGSDKSDSADAVVG